MRAPFTSLTDRVEPRILEGHILHCGFLGPMPFFVSATGDLHLGTAPPLRPHERAILVAASDGTHLMTGGDDGQICRVSADKTGAASPPARIAHEPGRWIDALALGTGGAFAYSFGKQVRACNAKGLLKSLVVPSTARGLAFAPKGYRLAISHIDGVSTWFPDTAAAPDLYPWKGPHLDVTFSPDNRFLVSSMQENQLHGWKLADKTHMRMAGYPGKTRSFSWSHDGLWLATSGAEGVIVWPFAKDGPTGKAPKEGGVRPARVTQVAFHPKNLVLAIGYRDGWVLLVRLTDAAELLVRAAGDGTPISALGWNATGTQIAFGSESGQAGICTLPV